MAHTVTYNSASHVIKTKAQGNLTLNEAKEIISKIVQVAKESNCFLCLSDYREAEINMSAFEIYDVPKIISAVSESQGLLANNFKRAIVVKKGLKNFLFYETVTLNSGQHAKLFQDIDEAKKWLSKK
jgi:hypothetical protein